MKENMTQKLWRAINHAKVLLKDGNSSTLVHIGYIKYDSKGK